MSSAQQKAGETFGQAKAKTEEWAQSAQNTTNRAGDKIADSTKSAKQSAQNTANRAGDKIADSTQSTKQSAQQGQDESVGFLQQTGEQVVHMAQGAIDGVKNTLGMNERKK